VSYEQKHTPFVILSNGRSRTFWLSEFLSYGHILCLHDIAFFIKEVDQIRRLLNTPTVGFAESTACLYWRLIEYYRPDTKFVIVKRDLAQIVASGIKLLKTVGVEVYEDKYAAIVARHQRHFNTAAKFAEHKLVVDFEDLKEEACCKEVFEFCLPYKHDHDHWKKLEGQNLQTDSTLKTFEYFRRHNKRIEQVKAETLKKLREIRLNPVYSFEGAF